VNKRNRCASECRGSLRHFLLALLFLLSGLGKLGAYSATAAYMSASGVPGAFLPALSSSRYFGSLAIVLGWKTEWPLTASRGFSVLAALTFHNNLADQMQMIMFFRNLRSRAASGCWRLRRA